MFLLIIFSCSGKHSSKDQKTLNVHEFTIPAHTNMLVFIGPVLDGVVMVSRCPSAGFKRRMEQSRTEICEVGSFACQTIVGSYAAEPLRQRRYSPRVGQIQF